jgi:predicted phosphodiesterase
LNVRKNGVLLFNPGSPTDKLFASERSYGVLEIAESIEGHIIRI